MDLRSSHADGELESLLTPYFMEFKQVEMGIECSAKGYMNLIDVVYCAQRAVLFPIAPLFDSIEKKLKPEFERALLRIFRICDKNNDGYLDDYELGSFQTEVFKAELQKKHITALKEVLIHECEDYDNHMSLNGVNFEAFKALQRVLVMKMKQQTCWTILRHFGYDDKLLIKPKFWDCSTVSEADLDQAKTIELTKDAILFLKRLFEAFKQANNKLDTHGMEKIFSTTEKGQPWRVKSETVYDNGVTVDIWVGLWQKFFNLHPKEAFKNLVYIGYCGSMKEALSGTPFLAHPPSEEAQARRPLKGLLQARLSLLRGRPPQLRQGRNLSRTHLWLVDLPGQLHPLGVRSLGLAAH